jgi:hypothetical protein
VAFVSRSFYFVKEHDAFRSASLQPAYNARRRRDAIANRWLSKKISGISVF